MENKEYFILFVEVGHEWKIEGIGDNPNIEYDAYWNFIPF